MGHLESLRKLNHNATRYNISDKHTVGRYKKNFSSLNYRLNLNGSPMGINAGVNSRPPLKSFSSVTRPEADFYKPFIEYFKELEFLLSTIEKGEIEEANNARETGLANLTKQESLKNLRTLASAQQETILGALGTWVAIYTGHTPQDELDNLKKKLHVTGVNSMDNIAPLARTVDLDHLAKARKFNETLSAIWRSMQQRRYKAMEFPRDAFIKGVVVKNLLENPRLASDYTFNDFFTSISDEVKVAKKSISQNEMSAALYTELLDLAEFFEGIDKHSCQLSLNNPPEAG